MISWTKRNRLNDALLVLLIFLVIFGFWGSKIIVVLQSQYFLNVYPQLVATFFGAALGVPLGLFLNSLVEKRKDKKILVSLLSFIKTELVSNQKYVENLQQAAENINNQPEIKQDDLRVLSKFTTILTQESYIAAQSSIAFSSISNDRLMDGIANSYLNIQRIVGGSVGLEEIEPGTTKQVLIAFIKLSERVKEAIRNGIMEIDTEIKKLGKKVTIVE